MRRTNRMKSSDKKFTQDKIIMYSIIGVASLVVVLVGLLIYSKNLSDSVRDETLSLEEMANITTNNTMTQNTQSASTEIGKSIEEVENETNTNKVENTTTQNSNTQNNTVANQNTQTTNAKENTTQTTKTTPKQETTKELNFEKPVDGEIMKEYASENLVYSNTLEEWVTHSGIDIKAEKTTVVKAAEAGTIKTIKNDPRYGLTIVIDHDNGFQTVYANLLTSEFVVEGEKVEKGQSIGTVGNTAVFEIADESHLHFEILKDAIAVDPSIYLK